MISAHLVSLFTRLLKPENRQAVAHELAHFLRLNNVVIFSKDKETATFLPAGGFILSTSELGEWQTFLSDCAASGVFSNVLRDPATAKNQAALGLSDADGHCVLVCFGGAPDDHTILALQALLPFLACQLANEHAASARAASKTTADLSSALAMKQQDLLAAFERAERELAYRREAENKFRVADRRKDEFIATISHELRTPLNAVLGWAEVLRIKAAADPGLLKGVDAIIRSAKTQANLINDLLDTSSIVAGKIVLHLETLDLADVLERARETVEPEAQQKNIRIRLSYEVKEVLNGDSARLRQVFWNLLSNAVKFTPKGGSIVIDAKSEGPDAYISITDTGLGIEADFLPYVFERFRQADASLRRKYGGLGLGLSIAKQFIEMHGGTITVSSEGAGKGTRFTVCLPHVQADFCALDNSLRPLE